MRRVILAALFVISMALFGGFADATTVVYNDFSNLSGMQLNGATAAIGNPVNGNILRLTNNLSQGGSAFSKTTIGLYNNSSFSTYFQFRISNPMGASDVDGQGADGIVFVVQTVANNVGGGGGGIGYQGIGKSVGIEFDTWNNGSWDDNSGNHVGIDLNGNIDSVLQTSVATRMNDGDVWHAWVDYNGLATQLEVRLNKESNVRPVGALLSYAVNLETILGTPDAYIGFTSGTGAAGGYHDILSWQFEDTYKPVQTPEPSIMYLLFAGLVGVRMIMKKNRE